jgi:hypothetical protein
MKDHHYMWMIGLLASVGALGGFGLDRWMMRTGGRSPSALAIAEQCVNWEYRDASARAKASEDIAATCERYFQFRSEAEAEADEQRWRQGQHK